MGLYLQPGCIAQLTIDSIYANLFLTEGICPFCIHHGQSAMQGNENSKMKDKDPPSRNSQAKVDK